MKLQLWNVWTGFITFAIVGTVSAALYFSKGHAVVPVARAEDGAAKAAMVPVKVVHPHKGLERLSSQPGTIQAYESVRLYAKVAGFLKKQNVDIGDRIKAGQVLAVLDVPELETQVKRGKALLTQARSRVVQMKARVKSAKSDLEASLASVTQAQATAKSSAAWVRFRAKQYLRMQELFTLKSIDERLVDESKERYEASIETEQSSKAAILTSKAHVSAAESKVDAAHADVAVAEADVEVSQAELEKYTVQQGFATITAPFDGVVSHRSSFPGDFVRSAESNGNEPLLTVQRTDLMRVIVQVPDRDVPFADPGDPAIVSIDALGGDALLAKISRIAKSEDPLTRLMHIEIDLPNPTGAICHGMYGRVSIVLDKAAGQLCIPSACLVGRADHGVGAVYVVRDHHAHLTKVRLGIDNGLLVGVVSGLSINEEIILQPGNVVSEGSLVSSTCDEVEQKVASK